MSSVFQEQYKCVYDTLEEYTVCGTSFFYVHQLSERLKQKSLKERTASSKKLQNEYEREYCVSIFYPRFYPFILIPTILILFVIPYN